MAGTQQAPFPDILILLSQTHNLYMHSKSPYDDAVAGLKKYIYHVLSCKSQRTLSKQTPGPAVSLYRCYEK